jgi:hypothetical protein
VTNENRSDSLDARAARIALLSDRVLGPPNEIDAAEAEDLLRALNIDPRKLKAEFHRRFDALAKQYADRGQRVPPLLKQALGDFRPGVSDSRPERELLREAQAAIRQVLRQARRLPQLLPQLSNLTLAASYRNKKELSEHDRELLDEVAEELRNRGKDEQSGPSSKRKR